jgi:hypothetical protein
MSQSGCREKQNPVGVHGMESFGQEDALPSTVAFGEVARDFREISHKNVVVSWELSEGMSLVLKGLPCPTGAVGTKRRNESGTVCSLVRAQNLFDS